MTILAPLSDEDHRLTEFPKLCVLRAPLPPVDNDILRPKFCRKMLEIFDFVSEIVDVASENVGKSRKIGPPPKKKNCLTDNDGLM